MSNERETHIRYRFERAYEALEEADMLWGMAHYNSAVNRLYYACFYAVSALLLSEGYSASTHAGTRSLFAQHFVKTKKVSAEMGDLYFALFHYRQETDYKDNYRIDKELAEPWLTEAKRFTEAIERLIGSTEQ